MKAIAITPGTSDVRIIDRPDPALAADDEIKVKVLHVGICGTDREETAGGRSRPPVGRSDLVIGHEMIGRVTETGKSVRRVAPGDLAVFTVRRGCGACLPCAMNRADMCATGNFTERGIWGEDGYEAEYVVDKERYVIPIPAGLEAIGVLTEPMSIVEKAIDEALRLQSARLPDAPSTPDWFYGRRCLVAGLGPVGLLGALVLQLHGAEVYGLDIVDPDTSRPQWLGALGGHYIDGREVPVDQVDRAIGPMDVILEAAGIAALDFNLLDALATNGIYALTGIPGGDRPIQISGSEVMRTLVLKNQLMVGSVNAAREHYQMAVSDLGVADMRWPGLAARLITHRYAFNDCLTALREHPADEIKAVVEWT